MINVTLGRFNSGKEPKNPFNRMNNPQSRSGRFEEEKDYLAPYGIRIPACPARTLVSIPTMPSQLPPLFHDVAKLKCLCV